MDSNTIVKNIGVNGYINGYCVKYEDNKKTQSLVDTKGKTVYSQKNAEIFPVDQNGLFLVKADGKYKVMDLNSNVAYTFENTNCTVEPLGNGLFAMKNDKDLFIYKISAN